MRWTRRTITEEIRRLHAAGEELNYAAAEEHHLNLVRAAAWHYGTWRRAVETAGLSYDEVSIYRRWTRERVLAGIRQYRRAGGDLSWRVISASGAPALAAAAVRSNIGFDSWHDAVTAAGIDYETVARYRHWTPQRVVEEIRELAARQAPLSSGLVQRNHPPLYNAARRRFGQWDAALLAAGIAPDKVRQRRAAPDLLKPRRSRNAAGDLNFEHLQRDEPKKRRAQPKKSLLPAPAAAPAALAPPPRVEPLPLRRRDKTGVPRVAPAQRDLYKSRQKEMVKRAKILSKAAIKRGQQPEKSVGNTRHQTAGETERGAS